MPKALKFTAENWSAIALTNFCAILRVLFAPFLLEMYTGVRDKP
jgi:hypothetical protein